MDNVAIHRRLTDAVMRGAISLPDGRTGLVFDGGTILAVTNPKVLSDFEASSILANTRRALESHAATLAAIENQSGSTRERSKVAFGEAAGVLDFGSTLADEGRLDHRTAELRKRRTAALASQIEDVNL